MNRKRSRSLRDRAGDGARCPKCASFLFAAVSASGKSLSHKLYEEMDSFHNNGHSANNITTPPLKRSKAAKEPSSCAHAETHLFQSLFLDVVVDDMPPSDKFDIRQPIVVSPGVSEAVLKSARSFRMSYRPSFGESYNEEQMRPVYHAVVDGLISIVYGNDEKVVASVCPTNYYFLNEKGDLVPTSQRRVESDLSHDGEDKAKKWKADDMIFSEVTIVDEFGKAIKVRPLRVLVEAKGGDVNPNDLFQASTNAWLYSVKCMQERKPVGRVYIEVWGQDYFYYGIQDIFGYLTIINGRVTEEAFNKYKRIVEKHRNMWGSGFHAESYTRCPQTLVEFQVMYDRVAQQYKDTYLVDLPSLNGVQDFPVGVCYFNTAPFPFPMARSPPSDVDTARFIQAHARILTSNWIMTLSPEIVNTRLLQNWENYGRENHTVPSPQPFPKPKVFKNLSEAGLTEEMFPPVFRDRLPTSLKNPTQTITGGGEETHLLQDVLKNPPARKEVLAWTVEDVKRLVRLVCGAKATLSIDDAVVDSDVDGSILLHMDKEQVKTWCSEIGLRVSPVVRLQQWLSKYNRKAL